MDGFVIADLLLYKNVRKAVALHDNCIVVSQFGNETVTAARYRDNKIMVLLLLTEGLSQARNVNR